jgi:hypothetical protein
MAQIHPPVRPLIRDLDANGNPGSTYLAAATQSVFRSFVSHCIQTTLNRAYLKTH